MMAPFSVFATEGYMPYFAHQYHHKVNDAKKDLDAGCTWELFKEHHANGWNFTLDKVARDFGGGSNSDNSGVTFTYKGQTKDLPYINGDDYEGIFTSSKIISTGLKKVKTSARVAKDPGYEYYVRTLHVIDGKVEMFFAKSLGEYYNDPDLNEIIFLHCLDVCGNPNEEYLISEQPIAQVQEERRPGRQPQSTTTAEGVVVNNYITNNNNSSSNQNQNQDQSSTNVNAQPGQQGMNTAWNPAGYYDNPQVGYYGYGNGVGTNGYGMGCNDNWGNQNYDRGYRPRTDNGWGNYGNNHNNRDHTMRNNTVRNYGGPRGHDYNPGNNGSVRNYGGPRGHGYNSGNTGNNGGPRNHNGGGGTTGNGGGHRFNRGGQ